MCVELFCGFGYFFPYLFYNNIIAFTKKNSYNVVVFLQNTKISSQDRMSSQGVLTQELKDKLLQQHKEAESSLAQVHDARRQQQVKNLQEKMAQRRKRKFDKLRDEQDKYKNEVRSLSRFAIN